MDHPGLNGTLRLKGRGSSSPAPHSFTEYLLHTKPVAELQKARAGRALINHLLTAVLTGGSTYMERLSDSLRVTQQSQGQNPGLPSAVHCAFFSTPLPRRGEDDGLVHVSTKGRKTHTFPSCALNE